MTANELVGRLEGVKRSGKGWTARCPSHDDRRASLSVANGRDGRVLVHCFAGCSVADIATALGVSVRGLFADQAKTGERTPTASYVYRDEEGIPLFRVVRKTGKQFRQERYDGQEGWVPGRGNVRTVLYRLPDIVNSAEDGRDVLFVEGEKDADNLARLGFVATTSPGGADGYRDHYAELLRGRSVVVIPDNDEPGRGYAKRVCDSLSDVAHRVRVLQLEGLPEKGDVSDWLASGHSASDLERRISQAPDWVEGQELRAPGVPGFESVATRLGGEREKRREDGERMIAFNLAFADDYCRGILPNDLVVVTARTGAGKTQLATMIAQGAAKKGLRAYFFALEAEPREIERRAKYRVVANRAWRHLDPCDRERLNYIDWRIGRLDALLAPWEAEAEDELRRRYATLHTYYRVAEDFDNSRLESLLNEIRDQADLVVLDHLHYVDTESERNENQAISRIVKTLRDAALNSGKPVVAVAHLRKSMEQRKNRAIVPDEEEILGSGSISKIATKIVAVAPALGWRINAQLLSADEQREHTPGRYAPTYITVSKDRPQGRAREVGMMLYDRLRLGYASNYVLGEVNPSCTQWSPLDASNHPRWAKRALTSLYPGLEEVG